MTYSEECPDCSKYSGRVLMKRDYVRSYNWRTKKQKFEAIGWICPECLNVILDDDVKNRTRRID